MTVRTTPGRRTQAERRARTRDALLEAAARGISRHGYRNLNLEQVARDAGYSRGALYHLFSGKEELALAVVDWVEETWWAEMADVIAGNADPLEALKAVARAHAIFCRRDIARVRMALTVEFSDQDHPVGEAVARAVEGVLVQTEQLIDAGRGIGSIPPGPPARVIALALSGAIEGLVINLSGQEPFDEQLAEQTVLGVLGITASHQKA